MTIMGLITDNETAYREKGTKYLVSGQPLSQHQQNKGNDIGQ